MVAARVPMPWSRFVALPMMAVHRLIYPVRVASNLLVITPLARLIAPSRKPPELSPEELEAMLKLSQHRGIIDRQEESTLQQVLTLGQIKVRDLMTPRVDVVAFDALQGPEALLSTLRDTRFNHVPVYEGHLDNVLGVIHARQALLKPPASDEQLRRMIKQVRFVPELQRADKLLLGFRKRGTTLAIVVDEYGGTAGLVTLHDVVELMVGQIIGPDESQQVPSIEQESPGLWRVSADLPLQSFAELFGPTVAATGGAVLRTLGGLVMARLGRLPTEGEAIELGNLRIEVAAMSGHRIDWLWVRLMDQKAQPQQPPATQIQRGVG
jgi:putative hemolysin